MFAEHYAKYYDLFNKDKNYPEEINFIYRWAKKPKSIIDIGCGTASYWKYYPKSVTLTGVEKSKHMIKYSPFKDKILNISAENVKQIKEEFDCATCLFDAVNYIKDHSWWKDIPIKKGGYFILDIWDKEKVDKDGFSLTIKGNEKVERRIYPIFYDGKEVLLSINILKGTKNKKEIHRMYVYSHYEIERFAEGIFTIEGIKKSERWRKWYLLKKI